MKSTDKFLIGIVVGVILLVVVAFVVALAQPKPTYQSEDTPEGVAYNYLFALQQEDYARAYSYLSSALRGYPPSAEKFTKSITDNAWTFRRDGSPTLNVESARVSSNRATISMRERRFGGGGLFSSSEYTSSFEMQLVRESGRWKIESSQRYWLRCWDQTGGCQ